MRREAVHYTQQTLILIAGIVLLLIVITYDVVIGVFTGKD